MSKGLMLDVDQAGKLKAAFRRARGSDGSKWSNEGIKKLSKGTILSQVLDVLYGRSVIMPVEKKSSDTESDLMAVDYSIAPSLVNLKIKAHPKRKDIVEYDLSKTERVLTLRPGESRISGYENLKRLKATGKTPLDVRVLEELLKHPELIPEEWKNGVTYFWGTIFCDSDGNLYVACLRRNGDRWDWSCDWLDGDWNGCEPAACLASS
jgi:hypothetical protein